MKYLRFQAVEDEDYGSLGLKFVNPKKMCNGKFTIQNGLLLAHDCIEHQQGHQKIGSIGDEMVALGGICFTRGQWGSLRRSGMEYYSPVDSISMDITGEMARLYMEQGVPFRQKLVRSRCEDPSGIVDDVIECARQSWNKRYDGDKPIRQERIDSYLEACRVYMLHGSKLADRRFDRPHIAHDLFWAIEDATDKIITNLEYEGQLFSLSYDFNMNVRFNEVREHEDYY